VSLSETSCIESPCCYSGVTWCIIWFFVLGMSLYITFRTVHALFSFLALVHCVSFALLLTYFHSSGGGVICVYNSDKRVLEHFT
jgi:hypothetical protein